MTDAAKRDLLCQLACSNELEGGRLVFEGAADCEEVDRIWDVLLVELVDTCGALYQNILEEMAMTR